MLITIPFKTPSINHLYWHRGNMKIMKKEAKKLKDKIKEVIDANLIDFKTNKTLRVRVSIFEDWFCLNGEVKRKDIANREKFLIDAVFDALNLDDKLIFEQTFVKVQSNKEFATIEIKEI